MRQIEARARRAFGPPSVITNTNTDRFIYHTHVGLPAMGADNHPTVVPSNHEGANGDTTEEQDDENDIEPNYGTL